MEGYFEKLKGMLTSATWALSLMSHLDGLGAAPSPQSSGKGPKRFELTIGLRGEIKIALGEAVDLVRPNLYLAFAPGDIQIRMMPFGFSYGSDFVGKGEGLSKILERIEPFKMSFCTQCPPSP
jgi:hypothetical protein